jgi:hypothetical protein
VYWTDLGNISGVVTINDDLLFFDPIGSERNSAIMKRSNEKSVIKFQATIKMDDIIRAETYQSYARIFLSSIGKRTF